MFQSTHPARGATIGVVAALRLRAATTKNNN